ncbi:SRPBCC family protein [Paenibacillus turpanensis]|uniref:SRPBCC family protein n=1 Tax=Paenibacillus turpanensis TaxID=2689078 RepID=UPI0014090B72|nr:SRPBCC family protein [Paenibacillus turpanensis]
MVEVRTELVVHASIERCFDLARDITVHTQTVWPHTKERAVDGVTAGVIGAGELVTFEAVHFGVRQRLTSKITEYERPHLFVDQMQRGAFKSLRHVHEFEALDHGRTLMRDVLIFEAPFGPIGWLVERIVLKSYMRRFLEYRNERLKQLAERESYIS